MHSSVMHTASSFPYQGSLPGQRRPWTETPLDRDPRTETDSSPVGQTPVEMLPCSKPHFRAVNKIRNFRYCHIIQNPLMHTTRSLPYQGSLPRQRPLWTETPCTETPPDRDPPGQRPPGLRSPLTYTETPLWTDL